MRVKILGTAAAEACPAIFCECENCREIRRKGDPRDLRRRASYLLDEDTLIDFGPDAFFQAATFNIDWSQIRRILFTHSHLDHQNATELMWRHRGYSQCSRPLKVFGSHYTLGMLLSRLTAEGESISFVDVLALQLFPDFRKKKARVVADEQGLAATCQQVEQRRLARRVVSLQREDFQVSVEGLLVGA